MPSRKRLRPGAVVSIDLGDGEGVAFGRVLRPPLIEFFDDRAADAADVDISVIAEGPVAFRVWVMDRAVRSARWPVIGDVPLSPDEESAVHWFFRQDVISHHLFRYRSEPDDPAGCVEVPASFEECIELECAAVWSPEHIEDRLRDHFAGRPNRCAADLRPHLRLSDEFVEFLTKATGRRPTVTGFSRRFNLATFDGHPGPTDRTTITMGLSTMGSASWRGLPLGCELVVCVNAPDQASDPRALLRTVLLEEHRRSVTGERPSVVERDSVFAPGNAPHLLFTTSATPTPELIVEKGKFGDRYINTMQAIPLDDAELRRHDRNPGQFLLDLASNTSLSAYPRSWPG